MMKGKRLRGKGERDNPSNERLKVKGKKGGSSGILV
jgi:hypothetical protein